jgi:hypothetical protein
VMQNYKCVLALALPWLALSITLVSDATIWDITRGVIMLIIQVIPTRLQYCSIENHRKFIGATTFSITTLSITTFSITTLSITTFSKTIHNRDT